MRQALEAPTAPVVVWTDDKRRPRGGAHASVFSYFSAISGIFHYWSPDCGDYLPDFADHADRLGARGHLGSVCAESVQDGQEDRKGVGEIASIVHCPASKRRIEI